MDNRRLLDTPWHTRFVKKEMIIQEGIKLVVSI